ncbi:hypothetical protein WJX75_007263 [Coccomyxa subellipsoidea]|uniref:Secreted protein n=1 Tax=Coccomyxa subellipsoidea TaxID=248742 RepID=A0ABR2Z4G0_9CHLO
MLVVFSILLLHQGVIEARLQSRTAYTRSANEPWTTTEGELASQTSTPNVIAWLDRAVHSNVMEALSDAGARLTQHGSGHLQHWEF